ncbi:MAG TPA: thiamine phosphate synthase [Candidatus Alistipes intestinigallinarum]|uniref:Thiamine-phosphate synthase n=1 Tax=Candidatus Alistipes intestinigallinarum TaxID=2838440 RepID=A0A9D2CCB3_9BACT|nr:thiamine phosphate synthase [Candidatus Alistipes intestinigallinarum]
MLQFITHRNGRYDEISGTRAVLEGGCRWVQLRMKDAPDEEVVRVGREVERLCREYGATFLVDDRVHLVSELGADGVHLGKHDMPVSEARRLLPAGTIIGATANTFEDIARAAAAGADYIGLGPFRFTETKRNLSPILGLEGYRTIFERCREAGITLPVVAIGGITAADVAAILAAGATGIALSGALLGAEDPAEETRKITKIINIPNHNEL